MKGYVIVVHVETVSWGSTLQKTVALIRQGMQNIRGLHRKGLSTSF